MPDISKITLPSGTTYNIKDEVARAAVFGGIQVKGTTTTALTDEATTNPIKINNADYTAVANDAVFYGKAEFIFDGTKWHEFGDMSGLGELAKKDEASASYKPSGSVSQPSFTGSNSTFTGDFTPEGIVSAPTIDVQLSSTSKYVATSATGGGAVTEGSAAACTLPTLNMSVSNETLEINWAAGSFTANKPTEVTLPSFSSQSIATGVSSATATQPTFTGTEASVSVSGTPNGSVSQPTFDGDQTIITVS